MPHSPASVQPFLPPTSSSSPHFPPVHQSQSSDLAGPTVASLPPSTVDGPLSSSQESNFHGNTVCLPSETSFTDSPQTPSVRTPRTPPPRGAARFERPVWLFPQPGPLLVHAPVTVGHDPGPWKVTRCHSSLFPEQQWEPFVQSSCQVGNLIFQKQLVTVWRPSS